MDDWNLKLWNDDELEEINIPKAKPNKRRSTKCLERSTKNEHRRAYSETQLLDVTPKELKDGYSYNYITSGDVDALSYLKIILRQQNLNYCLFSTWCMACDDVLQIEEWLKKGKIKTCDAYLGEIFKGSYRNEWEKLNEVIPKFGGRVTTFMNHSKIFAGIGDKFAFGIQTSANINTNPRTENGCITIGHDIYQFYKDYFDDIHGFNENI